jgi:HK97 family phage prohead protease
MENKQERRILSTEFRVSKAGKLSKLSGYAAVYNRDSEDLGGFTEQIAPGAFDAVLATNPDVRCLWNHSVNDIIGRTKSGTLTLRSDSTGLFYECQVPDTQVGRDLLVLADRGDVSSSSFGFIVDTAPGSERWFDATGKETSKWGGVKRIICKVSQLFDVSPVCIPAYPDSTVQARSLAEAKKFLQSRRQLTATDECARQDGLTFLLQHKR